MKTCAALALGVMLVCALGCSPTPSMTGPRPEAGFDAGAPPPDAGHPADAGSPVPRVTLIHSGGRVEWGPNGNSIAFDKKRDGGSCYDVYRMPTDGGSETCLTCGIAGLPTNNRGNPALDPTGRYLLVQVEQASHPGTLCGTSANPGAGIYNDLWIVDLITGTPTAIRTIPTDTDHAILHAHFSADGGWVSWSEMYSGASASLGYEFGTWKLMVAPCAYKPAGGLECNTDGGIATYAPLGARWYENNGFSDDGSRLYFTASIPGTPVVQRADQWALVLADGGLIRLTDAGYNEHGHPVPNGERLAWMRGQNLNTGTEFWLMPLDGGVSRQISTFNDGGIVWTAGDLSWSPAGDAFVGYVHSPVQPSGFQELIYRVDVPPGF